MKTILSLLFFLVIGLIGSRGLVSRVHFSLPVSVLFITGIEFFLIGIVLGPHFLDFISIGVLDDLQPVIYLALGWAGLLFGIQISWQNITRISKSVFKVLAADALIINSIFILGFFFFLAFLFPEFSRSEVFFGAVILAVTASISSPTIVAIVARRLPSRGRFTETIKIISALSALIPLFAFGLMFTVAHPGFFVSEGIISGVLWWLFANTVGIAMGFVLGWLTIHRGREEEILIVILGMVILVGGICYFLKLSVLYTSMIMGIVVGNSSKRKEQIYKQLQSLEKTIYIAFLIIIGATMAFTSHKVIYLLILYFLLRIVLKYFVSSWVLLVNFPSLSHVGRRSGLALSAQGGMALAIVLDFRQGTGGGLVDVVVATIALAVVLNEISGAMLTASAFRASGETAGRGIVPKDDARPVED
jgi:Kef-type K+ transport system membrane component KefB